MGPPWTLTLSSRLPCPQRKGGWTRRGGQGERSTPPPLGAPPAACPLKRRGAVARDVPLRAASRAYRPTSRARRPCIGGRLGEPGQKPRSVARPCGGFEEEAGPRACRTPAAALVQKAPKTALGRSAAPTQVHRAQCDTGEAPRERRRRCTRTPRRRRRSGWTGP